MNESQQCGGTGPPDEDGYVTIAWRLEHKCPAEEPTPGVDTSVWCGFLCAQRSVQQQANVP